MNATINTGIQLKPIQYTWLKQHGGRNINDVFKDEFGLFVLMLSPEGKRKVYLPK